MNGYSMVQHFKLDGLGFSSTRELSNTMVWAAEIWVHSEVLSSGCILVICCCFLNFMMYKQKTCTFGKLSSVDWCVCFAHRDAFRQKSRQLCSVPFDPDPFIDLLALHSTDVQKGEDLAILKFLWLPQFWTEHHYVLTKTETPSCLVKFVLFSMLSRKQKKTKKLLNLIPTFLAFL